MKEKIKEKKRNYRVQDFYQNKADEIKSAKDKEKRKLLVEQRRQNDKLESLITKNTKLRLKK